MNEIRFDYREGWKVRDEARLGDFDEKAPYVDNGTGPIDARRYFSRDYMELEWERVWTKTWSIACPVSDLQHAGDFVVHDIGRESFIVVKGKDDRIRAFYNVCPHRGTRLVNADMGSVQDGFTCPFHAWKFSLGGELTEIVDRETFRPEVVCHNPGLKEVLCEVRVGFVFITMNTKPRDLDEVLGMFGKHVAMYHPEEMIVVRHSRAHWASNWKAGIDAFLEPYHFQALHPQALDSVEDYYIQQDLYDEGVSRLYIPQFVSSSRIADRAKLNPSLIAMMADAAMDPGAFTGTADDLREAAQRSKRDRAELLGLDYSMFVDSQLTDSVTYSLFPNVVISCHPEAIVLMRFMPDPVDPERFFYDNITLYRPAQAADGSYVIPAWMDMKASADLSGDMRPEINHIPFGGSANLGLIWEQDATILPLVQSGMRSRAFDGVLLGEQELRVRHFHAELDRYMSGEKTG
jgi:carnitine monooxygenase subunit